MSLKILALSAVVTALAFAGTATPSAEPAPQDNQLWEGTIQGWQVDAHGTISIQLRTRNAEGDPETYWFRSPADRSGTTQFEDLLLRVLLDAGDQPLCVHAVRESKGDSVESAITIEAVSSMPTEGRTGRSGD